MEPRKDRKADILFDSIALGIHQRVKRAARAADQRCRDHEMPEAA